MKAEGSRAMTLHSSLSLAAVRTFLALPVSVREAKERLTSCVRGKAVSTVLVL
jgi:hypothetical protein